MYVSRLACGSFHIKYAFYVSEVVDLCDIFERFLAHDTIINPFQRYEYVFQMYYSQKCHTSSRHHQFT